MALNIKWIGSPNKRKGRNGFRPEAVVIHIMEGTLKGTDSWFKNPVSKVSQILDRQNYYRPMTKDRSWFTSTQNNIVISIRQIFPIRLICLNRRI